jgi:hypothetical protein
MKYSRDTMDDIYAEYSPLCLLFASDQGDNNDIILNAIKEIEFTMDIGKKYQITIEELE